MSDYAIQRTMINILVVLMDKIRDIRISPAIYMANVMKYAEIGQPLSCSTKYTSCCTPFSTVVLQSNWVGGANKRILS